jgi:hypothetical protein
MGSRELSERFNSVEACDSDEKKKIRRQPDELRKEREEGVSPNASNPSHGT